MGERLRGGGRNGDHGGGSGERAVAGLARGPVGNGSSPQSTHVRRFRTEVRPDGMWLTGLGTVTVTQGSESVEYQGL